MFDNFLTILSRIKIGFLSLFMAAWLICPAPAGAGELTGTVNFSYSGQEENEETFYTSETLLRLMWRTALSNTDTLNFHVQYFREDISNPETEQIRPLFGVNASGPKYRWTFEYSEFEQRNLEGTIFTQTTDTLFTTFHLEPGDEYPDLRVDFSKRTSKDDLEQPNVDYAETEWGLRTTYNKDPISFRYGHRENEFDNHLTFLTATNLQIVTGVAVDQSGGIYVTDSFADRVFRFSVSGIFLGEFGNTGSGEGQFRDPSGIEVNAGIIYVVDSTNHRVQRFNSTGNFISAWGSLGFGDGEFNTPYGIAIDDTGAYITDQVNDRVQKFTNEGQFLLSFGTSGSGSGNFTSPSGITSNGNLVFVADTMNHRIQVFNTDGTFLNEWGSFGSGPGEFQMPTDVALDSINRVFVTDTGNNRIQVFTALGIFLDEFGLEGSGPGEFNDPRGIAVNFADDLIIADTGNNRIQVLNNNGFFRFEISQVSREERTRSTDFKTDSLNITYAREFYEGFHASFDYDLLRSEEKDADTNEDLASNLRQNIDGQFLLRPYQWLSWMSSMRLRLVETETADLTVEREDLSQTHTLSVQPIPKIRATAMHTLSNRDNSAGFDEDSSFANLGFSFLPTNRVSFNFGYTNQQDEQDGREVLERDSLSARTGMKIYRGVDLNLQLSTGRYKDSLTQQRVSTQRVLSRLKLQLRPRLTVNTTAEYNTSDSEFAEAPEISSSTILSKLDLIWGISRNFDFFGNLNYTKNESSGVTRENQRYFANFIWRMNEKLTFFLGQRGGSREEKVSTFRTQAILRVLGNGRLAINFGIENGESFDRRFVFASFIKSF
jgi:hypothetical protein